MTKRNLKKNAFTKLILLSLSLLLTACSTTSYKKSSIYQDGAKQSADFYLAEASKYQGTAQAPWKLRAATAYLIAENFEDAYNTLLDFYPTELPLVQRNTYYLLKGESALQLSKNFEALEAVDLVQNPELESFNWNRHYQVVLADALAANERLADAAVVRLNAEPLFDNQEQLDEQHQKVWQELTESPIGALQIKLDNEVNPSIRGWLDLAIIRQQFAQNPRLLSENLQFWSQQYVNHPALNYIPTEVIDLRNAPIIQVNKVALIAPLNGRLAAIGQSLRDGFLAGYFQTQRNRGELPEILIYDSANGDSIDSIYNQAMVDGADMVIGPLLKTNVEQLALSQRMPLPTLVLNRIQSNVFPANFYQFGLPVEDEARQIAEYAIKQGQNRAFVINAEASVGTRATDAFVEYYQELGGTIVQVADISRNQDPKAAITRLLGVDQLEKRANELQNLLSLPIESSSQGSTNADFIFLIAKPKEARIIKPYLNYYYAYNLPVYATSNIYTGRVNPRTDNDLMGIMFTDAPWMLEASSQISKTKKALKKTLPNTSRNLGRFFALGHDAFMLIPELTQMSALSDYKVQGISGQLSMNDYGHIVRTLNWAQFEKGRIKSLQKEE